MVATFYDIIILNMQQDSVAEKQLLEGIKK